MVGITNRGDDQVGQPADGQVDVAGDVEIPVRIERNEGIVLRVASPRGEQRGIPVVQVLIADTGLEIPLRFGHVDDVNARACGRRGAKPDVLETVIEELAEQRRDEPSTR